MRSSPVKARLSVEQLETRNMPCATTLASGLGVSISAPPVEARFESTSHGPAVQTFTGPSYAFTDFSNGYKVVPSEAASGHTRSGSPAPNPTLQQGRSGSTAFVSSDSKGRSGSQGRSGARVRSGHQGRSGHADSGCQATVTPGVVTPPPVTPPVVTPPPVTAPVVTTPPVTAPVVTPPPVTAPVVTVPVVGLS